MFDIDLCNALSAISNTSVKDTVWSQAVLPFRWGGLGGRSITTLESSALLASSSAVRGLVHSVLPPGFGRQFEPIYNALLDWQSLGACDEPLAPLSSSQRHCSAQLTTLLAATDVSGRARFLASSSPSSG